MKLLFHELHISQHTVLSIVTALNKKERKNLTIYGQETLGDKQYYTKIQCSFMNLFENSRFKKL